jgi:hypothetical protein
MSFNRQFVADVPLGDRINPGVIDQRVRAERRKYRMAPRLVLVALLLAFGIASAAATITTIRQVKTANYALPQPVTRI